MKTASSMINDAATLASHSLVVIFVVPLLILKPS